MSQIIFPFCMTHWKLATYIASILSVSVVCSHAWQVTIAICVYQWFLNVSFKSCVVVVSGKKAEEHTVIGKSQLLESRYTKKVSQSFFKGDRWAKDVKPCLGCKKVIGLLNILTLIFTGFSTQHNQRMNETSLSKRGNDFSYYVFSLTFWTEFATWIT